ncbi:nucleopolyhedrovirus P10 family protein [Streptomyces sp. NPDC093094]|uniref:nucleopolyhedrovirus P10 family protein n=1 Tax=Streptomyces sp. NPDC093094 TaxID=3366026 RepID=UPI00380492CD
MTADGWTRAVRQQLGLGRLLPLGGPRDGAWIAESAAETVLRRAGDAVAGVRTGGLRVAPAGPDSGHEPAVPPPPSALPPGPLRVTAGFTASGTEPLPTAAARLRTALAATAADSLGLTVTEVDLRVTGLWEQEDEGEGEDRGEPSKAPDSGGAAPSADVPEGGDGARVAAAALAVAGVARLTGALGGLGRAVHIEERQDGSPSLPRRHVRVELAARRGHRALAVAREVRAAVAAALPDAPTVAVLITAVD